MNHQPLYFTQRFLITHLHYLAAAIKAACAIILNCLIHLGNETHSPSKKKTTHMKVINIQIYFCF